MRCIVCLKERPPSDEHVFPRAIGGSLKIDRVCTACNSRLGTYADRPLTDHPLIAARRSDLNLESNKGNVPEALSSLFGDGVLAASPNVRIKATRRPDARTSTLKVLKTESVEVKESGAQTRQIVVDASEARGVLAKILQREAKKAGTQPLVGHELAATVDRMLAGKERVIQQPEVIYTPRPECLDVPGKAFVKIAYELACKWLGDVYLADPTAESFRRTLASGSTELRAPIRGQIGFEVPEAFRLWEASPSHHMAFMMGVQDVIFVAVKVFDIFHAVLEVSASKHLYAMRNDDPRVMRFVELDAAARTLRERSMQDELLRIIREAKPRAAP